MNISFFSGKFFLYYLEIYNQYVIQFEEKPILLLENLYKEWADKITLSVFKKFIIKKIESLQEKFDFDSDEEQEPEEKFKKIFSLAMDKLFEGKYRGTTEEEEDEIRDKLYTFSQQLKKANFDSTNYSNLFFNKLKEVIVFSDKFQKQNMKYSIQDFFTYTDQLFEKEITKENEVDRQLMEENYNLFKNEIIPKIKKLFEDKKKTISEIYELGLYRCQRTIDNEIANSDKILKDANNNIELVSQNFEKKIDDIIKEINLKRVNEWNNMEEDIKKVYDNAYIKYYKEKKMNSTKIDINKGITFKMFASVVGSTISGIAIRSGLVMVGESLMAGAGAVTATASSNKFCSYRNSLIGAYRSCHRLKCRNSYISRVYTLSLF